MEKFSLKDGVYYYRKPFRKSQKANVNDIAYVELRGSANRMLLDIIFWGKNGKKLINFLDDGTAFREGKFERSLDAYQIPLRDNTTSMSSML